jgi:gliding motility-associated-like protein
MKSAVTLFLICVSISLFGQQSSEIELQDIYSRIIAKSALHPSTLEHTSRGANPAPPAFHDIAGSGTTSLEKVHGQATLSDKNKLLLNRMLSGTCPDTSFSVLKGLYNRRVYINSVTETADGNMLVAMTTIDSIKYAASIFEYYGSVMKLNSKGDLIWHKQFHETTPTTRSLLQISRVFELSNGDIACAGLWDSLGTSSSHTVIYRLTPSGNVIWKNKVKNILPSYSSTAIGHFTYYVETIADGLNGDVIVCGTIYSGWSAGNHQSVIRLNNQGQMVWDANYGNHGLDGSYRNGADGVAAFVRNGKVILVGLCFGGNNPATNIAINFYTLDYSNGSLLAKRYHKPAYSDFNQAFYKSFTHWNARFITLTNGNYLLYGKLFSNFAGNTPVRDHFGVLEFDTAFRMVDSYSISSTLKTNFYGDVLHFDKNGKAALSLFKYISSYEADVFFATFKNKRVQNGRIKYYSGAGLTGRVWALLKDNSHVFIQNYWDSVAGKNYFEFRKMHNSDTSSLCLGKDTSVITFLKLNYVEDPGYSMMDDNEPNKFVAHSQTISQTDTTIINNRKLCEQKNVCDSIKIHGSPSICGSSPYSSFSAFKNKACGAAVQWSIDSSAIDSLVILTDTSIRIYFKNVNWQGKLYATFPAGNCNTSPIDSFAISVVRIQSQINLGADTILCSGNSLVLHAGNSFTQYTWQNGSTDSILLVTQPGLYHVTASDQCGNTFSDTISVIAATYPFSIGSDTTRCNADTLHLSATAGFTNYQWSNNYNISSTSGQTVKVFPSVDTVYYCKAEKFPGCIVRDTIRIAVRTSPPIHLGNDTSLCNGESLTLNAGAGFSIYQWSTGSTNQQVVVNQPGLYNVRAIAFNGCISNDSLRILSVAPLPSFTLNADTTLCEGRIHSYNFNLPNASYLWQDGNTSGQYSISTRGLYSLAVTQNGCTGKDSVFVDYKPNPVVNLGRDSVLCVGTNYLLNAQYPNATYTWQDGSVSPHYNVDRAGTYSVLLNLNGCLASDTVVISSLSKPYFNLGNDTAICLRQEFLLEPKVVVTMNYVWQDGSTQARFLVKQPGVYRLTGSNRCGSYSDSMKVTAGLCKLLMPTAFTPNQDGLNDEFKVKFPGFIKSFDMKVYNRFGQLIFRTTNPRVGWNGKLNGMPQPEGAYVWQISLTSLDGVQQSSKGTLLLLR